MTELLNQIEGGLCTGLCEEPVDASSFLAQRQLKYGPWHPTWYNDKIDWLVVLVTVLMAVGLKCWLSQGEPSTEPQIEQKLEQTRSMFIESGESEELLHNTGQQTSEVAKLAAGPTSEASNIASRDREESEIGLTSPTARPFRSKSEDLKVRFELEDCEAPKIPEIRLPAAGEKYPLGLARFPGIQQSCSNSEALSWCNEAMQVSILKPISNQSSSGMLSGMLRSGVKNIQKPSIV